MEKNQITLKKRLDDAMQKLVALDSERKAAANFDTCDQSSKDDLIRIIEKAIKNIDHAMANKIWFEEYFNCVYEDVGIDVAEKDFKTIQANKNASQIKPSAKIENKQWKDKEEKKGEREETSQTQNMTVTEEVSINMREEEFNQVNK